MPGFRVMFRELFFHVSCFNPQSVNHLELCRESGQGDETDFSRGSIEYPDVGIPARWCRVSERHRRNNKGEFGC